MNILLFAPGLLLLLLQANGTGGTLVCLSICAGVQVNMGFVVCPGPWRMFTEFFVSKSKRARRCVGRALFAVEERPLIDNSNWLWTAVRFPARVSLDAWRIGNVKQSGYLSLPANPLSCSQLFCSCC